MALYVLQLKFNLVVYVQLLKDFKQRSKKIKFMF